MEQQQPGSGVGEAMMFGLIEQAEQMRQSAQETQRALTERIAELGQLQNWTVEAVVELQKQADAAIKSLGAERVALGTIRPTVASYAAKAMHEAIAAQSGEIGTLTRQALSQTLQDIGQAAGQVQQNVKETRWLTISLFVALGVMVGLALGYLPLRSDMNALTEHVNQIDGYLAAQQQQAAPPTPDASHASAHKGKK